MTFSLIWSHRNVYGCCCAFYLNMNIRHFGALAKGTNAVDLLGKTVSTYLAKLIIVSRVTTACVFG